MMMAYLNLNTLLNQMTYLFVCTGIKLFFLQLVIKTPSLSMQIQIPTTFLPSRGCIERTMQDAAVAAFTTSNDVLPLRHSTLPP
jgi:hypothetical protein